MVPNASHSQGLSDALNEVNKRLDRAIQLLQASLAVDTNADTKAIKEAQDRIEKQLKQFTIGGAAAQPHQPASVHTARRIPWDDIKFDKDEDDEKVILGSGSFGTVYAAKWCGEAVAAKTMSVKGAGPKVLADFWREADLQATLNSYELIVNCLGASERKIKSGEVVEVAIVIARMTGTTLSHWHDDASPPPLAKRLQALIEVARSLRFMHAQEIIHGDIKPANIMLDDQNRARIADLGNARSFNAGNADDSTLRRATGTPRYMDPAFARGGSLKPASDVYSFAITVWEVFTNKVPFDGLGDDEAVKTHTKNGGRPNVNGLPKEFAVFLERAWHGVQGKRPTMDEFFKELEKIMPHKAPQTSHATTTTAQLQGGLVPGVVHSNGHLAMNPLQLQVGGGREPKPLATVRASTTAPVVSVQVNRTLGTAVVETPSNKMTAARVVELLWAGGGVASVAVAGLTSLLDIFAVKAGKQAAVVAFAPVVIVAVMDRHVIDDYVQEYGCLALGRISIDFAAGQKAAVDACAPNIIVDTVRRYKYNEAIAKNGCFALYCIAALEAGQKAAVDALAPGAIVYAMTKHKNNKDITHYGRLAMSRLQGGDVELETAEVTAQWHKFVDESGKCYFVCYDTGETVWKLPKGAVLSEPVAAVRWHKHIDAVDIWYVSSTTGETVWELPKGAVLAEEAVKHARSTTKPSEAAARWHKESDEIDTWYVSSTTGETVWELPKGAVLAK